MDGAADQVSLDGIGFDFMLMMKAQAADAEKPPPIAKMLIDQIKAEAFQASGHGRMGRKETTAAHAIHIELAHVSGEALCQAALQQSQYQEGGVPFIQAIDEVGVAQAA